jgi:hypothetical protein
MIQTGFDTRIKIQQIIENQLPEYILDESPKVVDFLKQYYASQEYQSGPADIVENLDQYIKIDNLDPEVVSGTTKLVVDITPTSDTIQVESTKGYPNTYGLLKIDSEIITYTGITTNTFTGCVRGFSGISSYHDPLDQSELVFEKTTAASHLSNSNVTNLSSLFLTEFYNKIKYTFTPGLENYSFVPELKVGNFISRARDFYQAKGTNAAFEILFRILYNEDPTVVDLERYLIKPSSSKYVKRKVVVVESISGNPINLIGQTIKKSTDNLSSASVSNVETISRSGKLYYKLELYVGFDGESAIQGDFSITPQTKTIENVSAGSSTITVDSTVPFSNSGTLLIEGNKVTYDYKTINQFLGCSLIDFEIETSTNVTFDEYYYGYENGDLNNEVRIRITGIISKYTNTNDFNLCNVGEELIVGGIGREVKNPTLNKTYNETFSNTLIYNTNPRYYVKYVGPNNFETGTDVDKSSLAVGDAVDILIRGTQNIVSSDGAIVSSISADNRKIILTNLLDSNGQAFNPSDPSKTYYNLDLDIRRKLKKASSTGTTIKFGNNSVLCNVQNLYTDINEDLYVASNSLPEYSISNYIYEITIPEISTSYLVDRDVVKEKYTSISFDFSTGSDNFSKGFSSVPFLTGDKVYYKPQNKPIPGLEEGDYYVQVLDSNRIRLYFSLSFIVDEQYIEFSLPFNAEDSIGSHTFTLTSQKGKDISPQKVLRKFNTNNFIREVPGKETIPGSVGMLVNGVEIYNFKSQDKIYYGPIKSVTIANSGEGYDVINPPQILVDSEVGSGCKIQPVVSGSFEKVFVDNQEFDLDSVVSIQVTGGNGSGAVLEPLLERRSRKLFFDATQIDISNEIILFEKEHYLKNGDTISYSSNSNLPLGTGNFKGSNASSGKFLVNGSNYYAKVINSRAIEVYPSFTDFNSGINTVGFTTINSNGIHLFQTLNEKKYLSQVNVINGGSGYTHRKLIVNPSGISTQSHTISFENHGFSNGDVITYSYDTTPISGLSTTTQYRVLVVNNNSFRISDCGVGCTNPADFNYEIYSKLLSQGSGYQYFSYPEITVSAVISSGIGSLSVVGVITATPVVKGSIIDAYLYDEGQNYGSTVLNLNKKPIVKVISGSGAELVARISLGSIESVQINFGGNNYNSVPDLIVDGDGTGAVLRAIVENKRITEVIIINPGIGYSRAKIRVSSPGKNAIVDVTVRDLTVNTLNKFGDDLLFGQENLQYFVSGYNSQVRSSVQDTSEITLSHSPIIGWAYDGNPIYGSFGFSDPSDTTSTKRLVPGYSLDSSSVVNRPSGFPDGFFVEDYNYNNSGDLDECNGRYCKTPEFPDGVYAYFATTIVSGSSVVPRFPYFIGNRYRNEYIEENRTLSQSFDFNNSSLLRNTFPYKTNDLFTDNDGLVESYDLINQKSVIESISKGVIDGFDIINGGENYRVGDSLVFKKDITGSGLDVKVNTILGKDIIEINTTVNSYNNVIFTKSNKNQVNVTVSPFHEFNNGDYVNVSGLSTDLSKLNGGYNVGVISYRSSLLKDIPQNAQPGIITDIYVSNIPTSISIGSSIQINSEKFGIVDILREQNVLRVKRSTSTQTYSGISSTIVNYIPDTFTINQIVDDFDSKVNKLFFFNPRETIGLGTNVGVGTTALYSLFGQTYVGIGTTGIRSNLVRNLKTSSIFLPDHKLRTGDVVKFTKPIPADYFAVESGITTTGIATFTIPRTTGDINSQLFYAINNGGDFIGLSTEYGPVGDNLQNGLYGKKYAGYYADSITFFNSSTYTGISTITSRLYNYGGESDNNFSWQWFGYYKAVSSGINTFTVSSTGSSYLWIGQNAISGFTTNNALVKSPGTTPAGAGSVSNVSSATTSLIKNQYYPVRIVSGRTVTGTISVSAQGVGAASTASNIFYNAQESLTNSTEPKPLFFANLGSTNSYEYKIESVYPQKLGKVEKIKATVSVSTDHQLRVGDKITLNVIPNTSVGVGTTSPLTIKYNSSIDKIIIDSFNVQPTGINTFNSSIQILNHTFKTGDKVLYENSGTVGIETGTYFILTVDSNNIQLCETYKSLVNDPPKVVSIGNTGIVGQTISKINPQINPTIGNNLVLDVSDVSLRGYKFKLFYDNEFKNEFISVDDVSTFSLSGIGSLGYSGSEITLKYSENLPQQLYYTLEKSSSILLPDIETKNYSTIKFVNSDYIGNYEIFSIGVSTVSSSSTTFDINLPKIPERYDYDASECSTIEYNTTSRSAYGSINNLKVLSLGSNYSKLPSVERIESEQGIGAYVIPTSASIGKLGEIKLFNQGYEYPSDKTLRPFSKKSIKCIVNDYFSLKSVSVEYGGNNYISPPDIVFYNVRDDITVSEALFEANLKGNSITSVDVLSNPKGISVNPSDSKIAAINNQNGVAVDKVFASGTGIVTCILTTPVLGFSENVFNVGDEVFVEGIKKEDETGTGVNSTDLGYNLFKVTSYQNTIPAEVEYNVSDYTNDPGNILQNQDSFASIIKSVNYPRFGIEISRVDSSPFINGEGLKVKDANGVFLNTDLILKSFDDGFIVIDGDYDLLRGSVILGVDSGSIATIEKIFPREGIFETDYSTDIIYSWESDTGRLNDNIQVINDNDYYQNLSYTIKSSLQYNELITPVNSLLHPSGMKNFADTQLETNAASEYDLNAIEQSVYLYDIQNENRVDTINNYALAVDYNVDQTRNASKFIKLNNKKLTSYIKCISNRALQIDDISTQFTNNDTPAPGYADLFITDSTENYGTYLIQILNSSDFLAQLTDVVVIVNNNYDVFTLQRATLNNSVRSIGEIDGYIDDFNNIRIRFDPFDPFNEDYDIKTIRTTTPSIASVGVGSTSIGFVDIRTSSNLVSSGTTSSLMEVPTNYDKIFATIQLTDLTTNTICFAETYITFDGTDTYSTRYDYETYSRTTNFSNEFIGQLDTSISGGKISVNYYNDSSNSIRINTRAVVFGPTSSGIGTYYFLASGQPSDSVRSARYESKFTSTRATSSVGIVTYSRLDVSSFKAKIAVSAGSSSELHQFLVLDVLNDAGFTQTTQYPLLSINDYAVGIGTFGIEKDSTNLTFKFYPNTSLGNSNISIKYFAEVFQKEYDSLNIPEPLTLGPAVDTFALEFYNGAQANRINKLDYDANYNGIPIFEKRFNPSNQSVINYTTGTITIPDHFYNTGEELTYTPDTSFVGFAVTAIGIGSTANYVGVVTNKLPPVVYPIRLDNNNFKLATRQEYAQAGIFVTFTSPGLGNYHALTMTKKLEKSLVVVDSVVQAPVTYCLVDHRLKYNTNIISGGTGIGAGNTAFAISGISSIQPTDLLKIDDEIIKVNIVGLGTTSGALVSGLGTFYILEGTRGYAGTLATSHINDVTMRLYRGGYNIVGNKIWFTEPPRGNAVTERDEANQLQPKSSFAGRVFLRKDYASNALYDDISETFTGLDQRYVLTRLGLNTTGIGSTGGNGLVFINSIFQTPSTSNNTGNNFIIEDNAAVGITSIIFSGITSSNGSLIVSDSDVTQNQLPRGGLIVSLGSSQGIGYAPLVGIGSTALDIRLTSGSISSIGFTTSFIVGFAFTGNIGITSTIITGVTTNSISIGNEIRAVGVVTTGTTRIVGIGTSAVTINQPSLNGVALSTSFQIRSKPVFGSGYFGRVSIGFSDATGSGAEIYGTVGSGGSISGFVISNGGSGYTNPTPLVPPPSYSNLSVTGVSRLSIGTTTITGVGLLLDVTVGGQAEPTPISGRNADASRLILSNKTLIAEESVGRMLNQFPGFSVPNGNQNCIDDIVDVLEAISYNLQYGGNNQVYDAAKIYIDNDYLSGEETQSIFAFVQARDIAIQAMRNVGIGTSKSCTVGITTTIITGINTIGISTNRQVRFTPGIILNGTTITRIGVGSIFITPASINAGSISTSLIISQYSNLGQFVDYTVEGDISGIPGSYTVGDCADVASAIGSFVGIITAAISSDSLPANKVGIVSSYNEVKSFSIKRTGYGFKVGDVFKPVGLVTAASLSRPIQEFTLTVLSTFSDSFSAWQFGEMDYIDSIKSLQDGVRTRFPLFYNNELLSFETDINDQQSAEIDLGPILIVFANGVPLTHGDTYFFDGGSSFTFNSAPLAEDNISIFFYRGTREVDSKFFTVYESIKKGDNVQILKNDSIGGITTSQEIRTVYNINSSDKFETNIYSGTGVDAVNYKPMNWTKQKVDQNISGEIVYKSRQSLEGQIYPTAKLIKDIRLGDVEIFVDDAEFFKYEENSTDAYTPPLEPITNADFDFIVIDSIDPVSAAITATVSAGSTVVSNLTITNSGSGYISTASVKIAAPFDVTPGIGSTARASVSIVNGRITSASIISPGFGYTSSNPPKAIVSYPIPKYEIFSTSQFVEGFSGIITGIGTTTGTSGNPLAIRFNLNVSSPYFFPSGISTGYPIYIYDTFVGSGVTSIYNNNSNIVGIGSTYADNIYIVHDLSYTSVGSTSATIICNVQSTTRISGISTSGKFCGRFSWGRIFGFSRSAADSIAIGVSGKTVNSGLTTFPTIQRRGYGLRDTGGLLNDLS